MAGEKAFRFGGHRYFEEQQKDILSSKEKLVPVVNVITISGPSGTGKTFLANGLGNLLEMEVIKVGQDIRKWIKEQRGEDIIDFADRSPEQDKLVDRKTGERIIEAINENKKVIIEGKLAGWVCKNVLNAIFDKVKKPVAHTIFLKGTKDITSYRVWDREVEKNPDLTLEEVTERTSKRDRKDQEAWVKAYPELENNSPQSPTCVDSMGNLVYDQITDADNLTKTEVLVATVDEMLRKGLLVRIEPDPTRDEPSRKTDIFKAA